MDTNKRYRFPLTKSRLQRAWKQGFMVTEDGCLKSHPEGGHCILGVIESNLPDCQWSRLAMEGQLGEESLCTVWAFAVERQQVVWEGTLTTYDALFQDPAFPLEEKKALFQAQNPVCLQGHLDGVLYGQEGRYLFVWIEVLGLGESQFWNLRTYAYGDALFSAFPQTYQQDGEFFRRFLAIFSTLHGDLEEFVGHMHQMVDVEQAPRGALDVIASWFSLDFRGIGVSDEELRAILLRVHHLLAYKGTRETVEELLGILVQAPVYLLEQNLLPAGQQKELYGDNPYQCTVIIAAPYTRGLQRKIEQVLSQFLPVRTKLSIRFGQEGLDLDGYTYLDVNATVMTQQSGAMDGDTALNGRTYLE
ncbi:hypothetical protein RFF05_09795 [Bengtsoniella intestinalis]|uniref:hypothetical protein n=1 Tax=Bengtsoniella intestinalis TaxID=3073143 RepID=UPI00391F887C